MHTRILCSSFTLWDFADYLFAELSYPCRHQHSRHAAAVPHHLENLAYKVCLCLHSSTTSIGKQCTGDTRQRIRCLAPVVSTLSLSSSALKYVSEGTKGISCKSVCIRQHIHALLCCFGNSFHPLGTCLQ